MALPCVEFTSKQFNWLDNKKDQPPNVLWSQGNVGEHCEANIIVAEELSIVGGDRGIGKTTTERSCIFPRSHGVLAAKIRCTQQPAITETHNMP